MGTARGGRQRGTSGWRQAFGKEGALGNPNGYNKAERECIRRKKQRRPGANNNYKRALGRLKILRKL